VNAEIFADWLRRQGHHVFRTESSYWFNAGPQVFQAFPYHWVIEPSSKELRELMLQKKIVALRYFAPVDVSEGTISYHVVLSKPYSLETLNDATRRNIQRGVRNCQVEAISFERLAGEGWMLQKETIQRQGRAGSMSQSQWKRICLTAEGLPGFEAWAAIHEGKVVSALLSNTLDDTFNILYQQSRTYDRRFRVNNGLIYIISQTVLQRRGIANIFYGLHSLDAPSSVDEFKFRMGYSAKPVRQVVVFNPYVQPFINDLSHRFVKAFLKLYPGNSAAAKAEGFFRFYLQSKRPLSAQKWPKVLLERKAEILKQNDKNMEMISSRSI
jgi:hypothetical protein